ncbi:MAG: hypothetical protein N2712_02130 [Brevinematales bacterium]|nr:hypothetical protein [Brevinematales bacterium]
MRWFIFVIVFITQIFVSSCVRFAVISPTTDASSISGRELSVGIANYTRYFSSHVRKGVVKGNFFGIEVGNFISYGIPDDNFFSISSLFDIKISAFESSKNRFATGLGVSYLYLSEKSNNLWFYINAFHLVVPVYMESSMTEWFKFIVNFRFFANVFSSGDLEYKVLSNYSKNLVSANVGVEFFDVFRVEGYIIGGENLNVFPIPGFSFYYTLQF